MATVYQVARFHSGFSGPGQRWLGVAMGILRRHLKTVKGPYTIDDPQEPSDGKTERNRPDTLARVKQRMSSGQVGLKLIVRGANYDENDYAIRKADLTGPHPLIDAAEKYLHNPYLLGAIPPPKADCSGLTLVAAKQVYGIDLPHSAALQSENAHLRIFHDANDLEPDDFIFYVYGRLGYVVDHVALYASPGRELGARPSAGGVEYTDIDWGNVVKYGRVIS